MNQAAPRRVVITCSQVIICVWVVLAIDVVAIALNIPLLRPFLGLWSLFIIPGLLILLLLDIRCADIGELLLLIIGLSIAFLMAAGLLLNQVFRALSLTHPLASLPVLVDLFLPCLLASVLVLKLRRRSWDIQLSAEWSMRDWFTLFVPTVFPIISVAGAIILNNGGGDLIAIGAIILMAAYVLAVVWAQESIRAPALAYSIVMIGVAMLLSFSLRSWHISGWDINQEFYVFQLTKANQEWLIGNFRDPYNACLSITILPTISNVVLGINDEYIFKLVYQLIFAVAPLAIYVVARKYISPVLSYLSALFFIFQPWFIQPIPALARQEIGLLFFALFIWITFQKRFVGWQKSTLLLLFGVSLIVSHYSTAYIGLGMLTLALLAFVALKRVFRLKSVSQRSSLISGWVLLVLFGFTFYWSSILTQTSGNVLFVAQSTVQNMRNALLSDLRSEDIRLTLGLAGGRFDIRDVNSYIAAQNAQNSSQPDLYPLDVSSGFVPRVVTSVELPGTIGNAAVRDSLATTLLIVKQLTKVLLIVGAFILILNAVRSRGLDLDFAILNLTSLAVLFLFIALPVLSLYYNLYRIYIQTLIISSVSLIIGANFVLSFLLRPPRRAQLTAAVVAVFFLSSAGVAAFWTGGPATMNLNNLGEDYDKFYSHEQEVVAARWLSAVRYPNASVYADEIAALRLISFGNGILKVDNAILPSAITRDSYVYLDYANIHVGITEAHIGGTQISYNYPREFLEEVKDLIYDNGGAQIYK